MTISSKVLRMGVAGAGRMGKIHIEHLLETRFVHVNGICTPVKTEQEWAAQTVPEAKVFSDYKDLVAQDNIDAVMLVTPTGLHKEQVFLALQHGKHVFCEKPLALSASDAWDIYYESLKYPHLKVCCGFPRRYAKQYIEAARRIRNGEIGKVITLRSGTSDLFQDNEFFINYIKGSGGIFVDCNIHDIDACLFLLGQDKLPVRAYATGTTHVFPQFAEFGDVDNGLGLVDFEGGLVMNLYSSRDNKHGHHTMAEVIGTKGRILLNGEPRILPLDISDENGTRYLGPLDHMDVFSPAFKAELVAFRDWILYDKPINFDLKDAAKAVSIGYALMESLGKKQAVPVTVY
ncbi:hypothetical protein V1524DRAFT_442204 [Lipomyces starkeyi]|uniref:Gfo/Idh/MocA-like oxidoreductase N-terminal domain-containing protein n=1 Tax=Lipomyces starkeyi NRRL Y-11557 TaxID=675824 RepID=A0A1E3Q269_LIPST|nr:hypothetical protein LIPSTDRAFT_73547 [Lipomyces starkeyi NRRL Y-11557]